MFDVLALITLLVSLLAPVEVGSGDEASPTSGIQDGTVSAMTDGSPQPPGGGR